METTTLLPNYEGLRVESIATQAECIVLRIAAETPSARRPRCGHQSMRIHSHYPRTLADLPWNKVSVRIHLHARKFFCDHPACSRIIFAEPLPALAARYARKTQRLQQALYLIGYALGGEAGARVAVGLGLSVSPDTLLHRVRKEASGSAEGVPVHAVGVDDWAFRKGHRYGTLLVDLDRHRLLDLLPDRTAESLAEWLKAHPEITLVSRDRASAYSEAARTGAPQAQQVADRFHLLQNLGEMLERLLNRHHRLLLEAALPPKALKENVPNDAAFAVETSCPPPVCSMSSSRRCEQSENRRQRRLERYQRLTELHQQGLSRREIARRMGLSRNTVKKWIAAAHFREHARRPKRKGLLTGHTEYLKQRWQEGGTNATKLCQELRERGFVGSLATVQRYVQSWRQGHRDPNTSVRENPPSPRMARWWLLGHLTKDDPEQRARQQAFVERLCSLSPDIQAARKLAKVFAEMIRKRGADDLPGCLQEAEGCAVTEILSFAQSLRRDYGAVLAALLSPYSNGQTEGQVNRLKLIKRSMYGRANFDLLRARVLPIRNAA